MDGWGARLLRWLSVLVCFAKNIWLNGQCKCASMHFSLSFRRFHENWRIAETLERRTGKASEQRRSRENYAGNRQKHLQSKFRVGCKQWTNHSKNLLVTFPVAKHWGDEQIFFADKTVLLPSCPSKTVRNKTRGSQRHHAPGIRGNCLEGKQNNTEKRTQLREVSEPVEHFASLSRRFGTNEQAPFPFSFLESGGGSPCHNVTLCNSHRTRKRDSSCSNKVIVWQKCSCEAKTYDAIVCCCWCKSGTGTIFIIYCTKEKCLKFHLFSRQLFELEEVVSLDCVRIVRYDEVSCWCSTLLSFAGSCLSVQLATVKETHTVFLFGSVIRCFPKMWFRTKPQQECERVVLWLLCFKNKRGHKLFWALDQRLKR